MITFTKEQLIASAHARIGFAEMMLAGELEPLKERTWSIELELARIALASLEAEAVAWRCGSTVTVNKPVADDWKRRGFAFHPLYAAPPAPVSVPDEIEPTVEAIKRVLPTSNPDEYAACIGADMWNACRAAMLQGADQQQNEQQNIPKIIPFEQWLSQQTGTIDVECGCVMTEVFFHWLRVAYEAGNSPVIPDGYALVPVEPTAEMLQSGISAHYERSQIQINNRPAPGPMECAYVGMLAAAPQQE